MVGKPNQNLLDCPRDARQNSEGQMSRLQKDAQGLTPSKRCYLQRQSLTELLKLLILMDMAQPTQYSRRNPLSIHFVPETRLEKNQFSHLVTSELHLRQLNEGGSLSIRREQLHGALKAERSISDLLSEISHGTTRENALFVLMSTLPCSLHGNNRMGIKIQTMLLLEGFSNCREGLLYPNIKSEGKKVKQYLLDIEKIVN